MTMASHSMTALYQKYHIIIHNCSALLIMEKSFADLNWINRLGNCIQECLPTCCCKETWQMAIAFDFGTCFISIAKRNAVLIPQFIYTFSNWLVLPCVCCGWVVGQSARWESRDGNFMYNVSIRQLRINVSIFWVFGLQARILSSNSRTSYAAKYGPYRSLVSY